MSDIRRWLTRPGGGQALPASGSSKGPAPPSDDKAKASKKTKAAPAEAKEAQAEPPSKRSKYFDDSTSADKEKEPSKQPEGTDHGSKSTEPMDQHDKAVTPSKAKALAKGRAATPKAKKSNHVAEKQDTAAKKEKKTAKKPAAGAASKKRKIVIDSDDEYEEESSEGNDAGDADMEIVDEDDESEDEFGEALASSDEEDEVLVKSRSKKKAKTEPATATATAAAAKMPSKGKEAKHDAESDQQAQPATSEPSTSAAKHAEQAPAKAATPAKARQLPKSMAAAAAAAAPPAAAAPKPVAVASQAGKTPKGKSKAAAGPELDESAKLAIKAVDEAAKKLPDEASLKFSKMPEGADAQGNESTTPPNYGAKEAPHGHPDCLTGKTFVISGVLDSLHRPEAEDLIKRHGGKVTSAVSGRTTFLVVGENCGRSKYRTAMEKGTKLIDEDGLFSLIQASVPFVQQQHQQQHQHPLGAKPVGALGALSSASFFGAGPSGARAAAAPSGSGAATAATAQPQAAAGTSGAYHEEQLWVDKYKPKNSQDLVGNQGLVANLRTWLSTWQDVHLHGKAAPAAAGARTKGLDKKAVLISGSPGIGKTSAAHIIGRECGYEVVEMNASDTRNKCGKVKEGMAGKTSNIIKEMATNATIAGHGGIPRQKQLLIMDEVDGMSGGDRGGISDLIQTIKGSKIPIICICNDRYSQKLKSLRNHCVELDFKAPTKQQIAKRMMHIAQMEGMRVNENAMLQLAEGGKGDIRLILGQLQMLRRRSETVDYDMAKGQEGIKDRDLNPFNCASQLLDPATERLSITARLELAFADMDLVPLLVQENYLNYRPRIASNDAQRLRAIAKAADAISVSDVANRAVRRGGNWSLAPFSAVMGCVVPSAYMRGARETFNPGEMNFTRFTSWLGNFSSGNKQRRLLGDVATAMMASGNAPGHRGAVRLEYLSALRTLLTHPLRTAGEEWGVRQTLDLMNDYCIDREQFEYILDVTSFKTKSSWGEDPMKEVPTKVKSALTRTFNKEGQVAKFAGMVDEATKGKKGKKGAAAAAAAIGDEGLEGELAEVMAEETASAKDEASEEEEAEQLGSIAGSEALQHKLAKHGVSLELKGGAAAKGKGKQGAGASGSRAAARGGGGSGGKRGGGAGSGGVGRGKGKAKAA